jgi:hypothetical protein
VFQHVAFNDAGNLLFVWASSPGIESLYMWKADDGQIMPESKVMIHYRSVSYIALYHIEKLADENTVGRKKRFNYYPALSFFAQLFHSSSRALLFLCANTRSPP